MARHAVLLIGTEKTGSTTLQQFLARNRTALRARGVLYPSFCGDINHTGLAAYAMDGARMDDLRGPWGFHGPADLAALRARIQAAARAELADWPGRVVFCNEHCHSRLTTAAEVGALRALLVPFFDRIDIAVYLRRQDLVAISLYATQVKSGATHTQILPATTADDPYYNYDRSLALWEDVFGAAAVHPRLYDRAELTGGSIIDDFCIRWDLGPVADYAPVPDYNGSLGATAVEFLRRANPFLAAIPPPDAGRARGMLVAHLEQVWPGRGPQPARAAARDFYDLFRASNDRLRRRHFPDRDTLFSEDFGSCPEVPPPLTLTTDFAVEAAVRLHGAAMAEVRRLEAEVAFRDGRLAWGAGRRPEALAALRRATAILPEHPEMLRTLAEYLFHGGDFPAAAAAARRAAEARPAAAEYWHFLGLSLRRAGDPAAAATAQRQALAAQADYPAAQAELDLLARSDAAGPAAGTPTGAPAAGATQPASRPAAARAVGA
ncbi:MAG: tetratricopeptide repeat protein [Rhodobacteraceae bacterium]|jgi:hypothetical protein|nr:tetratricopeptide repeat protein [Paracoccaceae bacterium]